MKISSYSIGVIALLQLHNLGRKTVFSFLRSIDYFPSDLNKLREVFLSSKFNNKFLVTEDDFNNAIIKAKNLCYEHEAKHIGIISYIDTEYPQKLREINDPPLILYFLGDISCLQPEISIAVIGTRNPTNYGRERARKIAKIFAENKLIIVSGLATGCDTEGHQGCLDAQGRTVAVLAHGLDSIYPVSNRYLAEKIVDTGGCLVSEYPIGARAYRKNFVERDRIQSGLSSAVVIIETDIVGGTMHTAKFCLEQGRKLACINHLPDKRTNKSQGNQKLIREKKAIPLRTSEELNDFINLVFGSSKLSKQDSSVLIPDISSIHEKVDLYVQTNLIDKNFISQDVCDENRLHSSAKETSSDASDLTNNITNQDNTNNNSEFLQDNLSCEQLSKRLNVTPETVAKNRKKGVEHFKVWSQKKDPEKLIWFYEEATQKYEILC